ncbi:uncharacterized protein L969DRAFT_55314 [Mixia osmundae IAM 14324]|uniref:Mitochondrial inner membrane protein 1 n=1 Tax=Mixia osmundae (strain CBS 9802 / IAM 14324 / JCM 22182 / KY 12970) TaxID=764103 RepID=G7E4G9_MIXOS|nr:uncharacterized protein L969DRAFT_55314 [Mixia osmundae IAM 14324]KEI36255.1 hypothetical protein L969DRAFT_55314 [Mixia osmundae IAM 14324]GAA97729.1 hypothetical protein E5Q_04408 [Mixia osmundae IAM 14324]
MTVLRNLPRTAYRAHSLSRLSSVSKLATASPLAHYSRHSVVDARTRREQPRGYLEHAIPLAGNMKHSGPSPLRSIEAHRRHASSSVAGQPASSSFKETGQNAKQEASKAVKDVTQAISGANATTSQLQGGDLSEAESSLKSVENIMENVPREAIVWGAAGLIPYVATSLTTVYLARVAGQAQAAEMLGRGQSPMNEETALALLHHVEHIQVSYGAIILSFLGALHWGMEFSAFNGRKGNTRYVIGIVPVAVAWSTLLVPTHQIALAIQWAAFVGVWWADWRTSTWGWTPKWYATYRFGLTAIVGSAILVSLGGANYFGPDKGGPGSLTSQRLAEIRQREYPELANSEDAASGRAVTKKIGGDINAEKTKSGDAYVQFTNVPRQKEKEEEERKKAEEEEKKKQAEAAKEKKAAVEKKRKEAEGQ